MNRTPCFCSMFSELFYFVGRDIEVSENESNVTMISLCALQCQSVLGFEITTGTILLLTR
jgi:hypothetical protein